jgi:Peptidase A4 family
LPAEAVDIRLAEHPGDLITASVTIANHTATLGLRNLSTGKRFTLTRRLRALDVSSAEWIVEAPLICPGDSPCNERPLADFGDVTFSSTSATAQGHTGPIAYPAWSATALELRQSSSSGARQGSASPRTPSRTLTFATPSSAANAQGAFTVRWQASLTRR